MSTYPATVEVTITDPTNPHVTLYDGPALQAAHALEPGTYPGAVFDADEDGTPVSVKVTGEVVTVTRINGTRGNHAIASEAYIRALAETYRDVEPTSAERNLGRETSMWGDVADGKVTRQTLTGDTPDALAYRGVLALAADRLTAPVNVGRLPEHAHPEQDRVDLLNWVEHCGGMHPNAQVMAD